METERVLSYEERNAMFKQWLLGEDVKESTKDYDDDKVPLHSHENLVKLVENISSSELGLTAPPLSTSNTIGEQSWFYHVINHVREMEDSPISNAAVTLWESCHCKKGRLRIQFSDVTNDKKLPYMGAVQDSFGSAYDIIIGTSEQVKTMVSMITNGEIDVPDDKLKQVVWAEIDPSNGKVYLD